MKKLAVLFTGFLFVCASSYAQTSAEKQKIESLIKQMTLEEKVGQMTQVTLAVVAKGGWGNQDGSLDPAALKKAVEDYKVGSILNTTAHALSVDTWRNKKYPFKNSGYLWFGWYTRTNLYTKLHFVSAEYCDGCHTKSWSCSKSCKGYSK